MQLRIATRGSQLALWQARHIKSRLEDQRSGLSVELVVIKTKGDKILDKPLAKVGGKGLFVKEIEEALLDGRADLAVHSMKDVPALLADGLELTATTEREVPNDALVAKGGKTLSGLNNGAIVGTSSLRRFVQLRATRSDLRFVAIRGNVDTRLRKLDTGDFDALVLAAAGLRRLRLAKHITELIDTNTSLPAIGQGALGLECRADDAETKTLVSALHHVETAKCVSAERTFLAALGGSCQTPIAGYATLRSGEIVLEGLVADPRSNRVIRQEASGTDPREVGEALAHALAAQGAMEIVAGLEKHPFHLPMKLS